MIRMGKVLLILAALVITSIAGAGEAIRKWEIPATGSYRLAFMTPAEHEALLDAGAARVKVRGFLRRNPDDFCIEVRENEALADTLDRIVSVVQRTAIVSEHMIVVVVKPQSVRQLRVSNRRPFAEQLERQPESQGLHVAAGDVVLLQAYDM